MLGFANAEASSRGAEVAWSGTCQVPSTRGARAACPCANARPAWPLLRVEASSNSPGTPLAAHHRDPLIATGSFPNLTASNIMPQIVQFTHPGPEHGPDSIRGNHKSWNAGQHRRKFMRAEGDYIAGNGRLGKGELLFWGEWEPPSEVQELATRSDDLHPRWLHSPYLPSVIPAQRQSAACSPKAVSKPCSPTSCASPHFQNTDPFVFGDCFKYFVCKQWKKANGQVTKLSRLEPGSMILFGSTHGPDSDAFFQLDTVFVVVDYLEYSPSNPAKLPKHPAVTDDYLKAVFRMLFSKPDPSIPSDLKLRLYFGATASNPVKGMYSFAPARLAGQTAKGFSRVPLQDLPYLTNNLNSAPRVTDASKTEVFQAWKHVRDLSRKHGCLEGVRFDYTKK